MRWLQVAVLLVFGASNVACEGCDSERRAPHPSGQSGSPLHDVDPKGDVPARLDLPPRFRGGEGGADHAVDLSDKGGRALAAPRRGAGPCPSDMVLVLGSYCVDRYEASLSEARTLEPLSPYYPPTQELTVELFRWFERRAPESRGRIGKRLPVPAPPVFQLEQQIVPLARSAPSVTPAGYLTYPLAKTACESAGKRLCRREEWVRACRGEADQPFPYGPSYRDGACNVHRKSHPARLVHGDTSEGHRDPRLNLTSDEDGPLLRLTGETQECRSAWGADSISDMVGNIDEWIDDPDGTFVGGFYSRATRAGCEASIEVHAPGYFDYSLGTRCCKDAE